MLNQKLIITGASGLLGHALCRPARESWEVYGVYNRHRPGIEGIQTVQTDLSLPEALPDLMASIQPQAVVHAAAIADVGYCQQHPGQSAVINVEVPAALAKLCHGAGISYVFVSTDLVFDGNRPPYRETDPTVPLGVYARHKAQAEQAVLQACPAALVCRLPLMIGLLPHPTYHFSYQMLQAIAHGHQLNLFIDEFRTPVDTDSAAAGILTVLGKVSGLLHLGGRARFSRYDLGILMAGAMRVEPTMIRPISVKSAQLGVPRAPDVSLDSTIAYGLGYDPMPLPDSVQRLVGKFQAISKMKEEIP